MAGITDPEHEVLETLREAQRFGFFGSAPIEQAVAHAESFVTALAGLATRARVIDLGSGGGLPGLWIAHRMRSIELTLIDRRQKRTDFLAQAVSRLRFDHVRVVCEDVARHADGPYSAATARGFGPPETTLRMARRLVEHGGRIVISEPPQGERWSPKLLAELDLESQRVGSVRVFHVKPKSVSDTAGGGA